MEQDGLRIEVSKEDFINAPETERSWMMFQAIQNIDQNGCRFAKKFHQKAASDKLKILGATFGAGVATAVALWKMIF